MFVLFDTQLPSNRIEQNFQKLKSNTDGCDFMNSNVARKRTISYVYLIYAEQILYESKIYQIFLKSNWPKLSEYYFQQYKYWKLFLLTLPFLIYLKQSNISRYDTEHQLCNIQFIFFKIKSFASSLHPPPPMESFKVTY